MSWLTEFFSPDPMKQVCKLDLRPVCLLAQTKLGWDERRISRAKAEYVRFLTLCKKHSGQVIVPWDEDLDQFWHLHIQDTRKYHVDCMQLFGRVLHHNPHLAVGTSRQVDAFSNTKALHRKQFGSRQDPRRHALEEFPSDVVMELIQFDAPVAHHDSGRSHGGHDFGHHDGTSHSADTFDSSDTGSGASCGSSCGSSCGGGCGGD